VHHATIKISDMTQPKWSILVVSYNASAVVQNLLADLSILPSHDDCEILVAENGTEELDAMSALAAEFRFQLIRLPNPGFGALQRARENRHRRELPPCEPGLATSQGHPAKP